VREGGAARLRTGGAIIFGRWPMGITDGGWT
jgi:hypothetical protein